MILVPVTVKCDESGCDREFEADMPFVPPNTPWGGWRAPSHWASPVAPLTESEFQAGLTWRIPGPNEPTTAPIYCPTHAAARVPARAP